MPVTLVAPSVSGGTYGDRKRIASENQARIAYNELEADIRLQLDTGTITESEAVQKMSEFIKSSSEQYGDWSTKEFSTAFGTDWKDTIASIKTAEVAGTVEQELGDLATTIAEQLGVAKEEAMGFLGQGEVAAKETLAAAEQRGLATLGEGEIAALGEIEAGKTAVTEAATGALAELGTAREAAMQQIEAGVTEAGAIAAPWKQAGEQALQAYQQAFSLGGDPAQVQGILQNLPGFQFRMEQGLKATQRIQSAGGRALGGRALQELQATGQGIASEEIGRYLGGLSELMGRGQEAGRVQTAAVGALRGQGASLEAGFGQMRAGVMERQGATLAQLGTTAASIRQDTAAKSAALITDVAGRTSMIESATAGMRANLTTGTASEIARTAGTMGMQAAGVTSDFYKMVFNADVQKDIAQMQMDFQRQMAQFEADMAQRAAATAGEAQLWGSLIGAGAKVGAAYLTASDRRVKENIITLGSLYNGLPIYSYNYLGNMTRRVGVMAQDVEKVIPDAVVTINGIKHVDYSKVLVA